MDVIAFRATGETSDEMRTGEKFAVAVDGQAEICFYGLITWLAINCTLEGG